jgi:Spy/CpxP family protein refolding chaperone
MQSNQDRRAAYAAMNLSEAQKTRLKQVKQSTKSQIEAILTPAQRQQLQQKRQELGQQRNQQRNSNQ